MIIFCPSLEGYQVFMNIGIFCLKKLAPDLKLWHKKSRLFFINAYHLQKQKIMKKTEKEKNTSTKAAPPAKQASGKTQKKGKTAKELVSRHIADEDDVISEEEFKNLNIETEISGDTTHEPLDIPENPDRPKDEDKDHKIITPWDAIS